MKKFIITDSGSVCFDPETEEISTVNSRREGISRIWIAEEPMTVAVKKFGKEYELQAKKGDIIISFYDETFPSPAIIVKSKDWVKNIETYDKIQAEYEAKRKAGCTKCDACDACEGVNSAG